MQRPFRCALGALAVSLLLPASALAGTFTTQDVTLTAPTADGSAAVTLHARVYQPDGDGPANGWPAVVYLHGWGESQDTPETIGWARSLAGRGYVVLTYSSRGWGGSGGLADLAGASTLGDVRHAIEWLGHGTGMTADADNPGVDASRIALMGTSYGGGQTLLSAVRHVPVRAVVAVMPWSDLKTALDPGGWIKGGFVARLFSYCLTGGGCIPDLAAAQSSLTGHTNLAPAFELMRTRSTLADAGKIVVPTLLIQGRRDFLFPNEQTIELYKRLPPTTPKAIYFGGLGHFPSAPNDPREVPRYRALVADWFDRYVRGVRNGVDVRPPVETEPDAPFRDAPTWTRDIPAAVVNATPVLAGTTTTLQAGGTPMTFVGAPVTHATYLRGTPTVSLDLSTPGVPLAHVDAELWVVSPTPSVGVATRYLVGQGACWFPSPVNAVPASYPIPMSTITADVPAGWHVELAIVDRALDNPQTEGLGWAYIANTAGSVEIGGPPTLTLPVALAPARPTVLRWHHLDGRLLTVRLKARGTVDYGDGTRGTGKDLVHRYRRAGRYRVTATRYDANGFGSYHGWTSIVR
jgi:fermentation-respiration switch protein FrsA (DUF1100 family)